jgi:hypothetical protein
MPRYNVTLNLTFAREYGEHDDYLDRMDCLDEDSDSDAGSEDSFSSETRRQALAFRRTDAYFQEHSIEEHVKSNDAFSFVEFVCCDGEVVSAEWDKEKFQIHMVVETTQTKEELIRDLESNSLEDGEYEACGDTGWIVMTRGPNGELFDSPWDTTNYWCYGLTDYRRNPIEVEEIKTA